MNLGLVSRNLNLVLAAGTRYELKRHALWFVQTSKKGQSHFNTVVNPTKPAVPAKYFVRVTKREQRARHASTTGSVLEGRGWTTLKRRRAPSRKPYFSRNESSMRKMLRKGRFKLLENHSRFLLLVSPSSI